ncbi:uncharacterized protein [Bombus flavifrons]|uniref:uncharacterized protein n=1 Tax=Bombus flavifrons TaxID=103934 RepID=UPI0037045096
MLAPRACHVLDARGNKRPILYDRRIIKEGCEARDSFTRVTYQILSDLVTCVQHCPESEMVPAHVHRRTTTYTCNTKLHIYMCTCSVHVMIVTEEYHSLLRNRFSILESNTRKIKNYASNLEGHRRRASLQNTKDCATCFNLNAVSEY